MKKTELEINNVFTYIHILRNSQSFKSRSSGFYVFSKSGKSRVERNMKIKVI